MYLIDEIRPEHANIYLTGEEGEIAGIHEDENGEYEADESALQRLLNQADRRLGYKVYACTIVPLSDEERESLADKTRYSRLYRWTMQVSKVHPTRPSFDGVRGTMYEDEFGRVFIPDRDMEACAEAAE